MRIVNYTDRGNKERQILTGMIVNSQVLSKVAQMWSKDGCFAGEDANVLGELCVKFWQDYGQPPGKNIEGLLLAKTEHWQDKSRMERCEKLLSNASDEYENGEDLNADAIVDAAESHFTEVRIRRNCQLAVGCLDSGQLDRAVEIMTGFEKMQIGSTARISPLKDAKRREGWFDQGTKPILRYDGALGEFMRNSLGRGKFVSFAAPEKVGKSFSLLDIAWRLVLKRRRVAFFEVGDMTEPQVGMRWGARVTMKPYISTNDDLKWPCLVQWPTAIHPPQNTEDDCYATVDCEERKFDGPYTVKDLDESCQRVLKHKIKKNTDTFLWEVHPTHSLSAYDIRKKLIEYRRELDGWTPDCVVIDYADILGDYPGKRDPRESINANWGMMRRISQEFHCLLVTATQANRDSYDRVLIGRKNIGEDKRKLAHVDGMIGINVTSVEKERSIARWNWFGGRENPHASTRVVHLAQCFPLACPTVLSCWSKPFKGGKHG